MFTDFQPNLKKKILWFHTNLQALLFHEYIFLIKFALYKNCDKPILIKLPSIWLFVSKLLKYFFSQFLTLTVIELLVCFYDFKIDKIGVFCSLGGLLSLGTITISILDLIGYQSMCEIYTLLFSHLMGRYYIRMF